MRGIGQLARDCGLTVSALRVIRQALDAGGSGQLVLELDGPLAPLAIRVPDGAGDVSMLMPVRLP